ncbi:recombinase family protein [Actinomadura rubrisoli]|uniref:recombinase family protein n=1 Tax=Actinomadura rubrisoli TaxID=2530368 RepID=UPI001404BFF1|nr:recombinase family protein [Actinomadura rubrisoli]
MTTTDIRNEIASLEDELAALPDAPLRAVIYARVSQDPKEQLRSVSQQIDECTAECARRGWSLVKVFKDNDRSASRYATKDRPQYAALKTYLREGNADVLVMWESSRAQRDLEDYVKARKIAEDNGVKWSYKGRLYDLTRTDDRFATGLDALLDERESSITRDRILRDVRGNAQKGRPHGRLLYGYRREYNSATGDFVRSVIRQDQAQIVREAVRRIAAGEGILTVCRDFNRRGLRTNHGNTWRHFTIRDMVTNPAYIGKRVHQGKVIGDAEWPPILTGNDRQAFFACVRRLNAPGKKSRPGGVKHLATHIATCGICGAGLSSGRNAKKVGQTQGTPRYNCRGDEVLTGGCTAIGKSVVDNYINGLVIERLSRPDAAELLTEDALRAEHAAAALAEAEEKRAILDETADKVAAGTMSVAMASRIEARLLPEIEAAELRANDAGIAPVLREVIRPDIGKVWPKLPMARRREVVRALMDITVTPPLPKDTDQQERQRQRLAFGQRLRELRRGYGLLGMGERQLAKLAGWPPHKVNNAELARGSMTADDVRVWCRLVDAEDQADAVIAMMPTPRAKDTDRIQITWKHDL